MTAAKNYNFAIEVDGIEQLWMQKASSPSVAFQEHKMGLGGDNPDIKVPGKKIVGDLVCEGVVDAVTSDGNLWKKFQNQKGKNYWNIVSNGYLIEKDNNGKEINRFEIVDLWVKEIPASEYVTGEDGANNLIRKVTFSVYDYLRV
jgi:hypothetical protein